MEERIKWVNSPTCECPGCGFASSQNMYQLFLIICEQLTRWRSGKNNGLGPKRPGFKSLLGPGNSLGWRVKLAKPLLK